MECFFNDSVSVKCTQSEEYACKHALYRTWRYDCGSLVVWGFVADDPSHVLMWLGFRIKSTWHIMTPTLPSSRGNLTYLTTQFSKVSSNVSMVDLMAYVPRIAFGVSFCQSV